MREDNRNEYYYNDAGYYEDEDIAELAYANGVLYKGDNLNPYRIAHAPFHIPIFEKDITIHPRCEEIEDDAFYDCDPYNIRLPKSVKRIGKRAFAYCGRRLKKIIIKEGTEYIDEQAFFGCNYVARIELPSTIKELGKDCFTDISWLLRIVYNGTKKQWNLIKKDDWITGENHFNIICKDGIIRFDQTKRYCGYDKSDNKVTLEFVKDSILEILNTDQLDNINKAKSFYNGLNAYLSHVEKLNEKEIKRFYKGLARLFVSSHGKVTKEIHQTFLEITGLSNKEMSYKRFTTLMTSKTYECHSRYAYDLVTTTLPRYRRFYTVMIGTILISGNHKLNKKDMALIYNLIGPMA